MQFEEIAVSSLGDLVDRVTPEIPDPATGRRRDTGIYRGCDDASWPLLTSLDRLGGVDPPHTKAPLEEHIFRNFTRYSRPFLTERNVSEEWELLILAQHHGLPTRLLDWTYSPLVAAHFATACTARRSERVVWRLDWQRVHRVFGFPELAFRTEDLKGLTSGKKPFTPWDLFRGERISRPFACMVEPPSLDIRITTQSAVFTLCSEVRISFGEFLARNNLSGALTKYTIPAAEVSRFRDQLDLAGVDERRLFPDLDGLSSELRRYYA